MEKLTHLNVSGFRSVRNFDSSLGGLTVLIGANGSGKSNFIALFNMLSWMLDGNLQTYIQRKGSGSSILHYGPKRTPVLRAELTFEGEGAISKYRFSLSFASPDRLIFTEEWVYFRRHSEPKPFTRDLRSAQEETKLIDVAAESRDTVPRKVARIFLHRLRGLQVYHFHDTSEHAFIRTAQDLDRNRYLMSSGGNLAAFLYMLQNAHPDHFKRILETVRLGVPHLHGFELAPDHLNPKSIQLRWRDRNPDYEFGAHQLSDGSLRFIALVTALMQPDDLLPALIAIDEPELGLHPNAITIVSQLIKAVSAKRQVIVASQSPRLVSGFAPEDVVVVEREEEPAGYGFSKFRRLDKEALGSWLDNYDLGQLYEMNVTGGGPA